MKNSLDEFFNFIINSISTYNPDLKSFHLLGDNSISITTEIEYLIEEKSKNKLVISVLNPDHTYSRILTFNDFQQFFKLAQFFDPDQIIKAFFYMKGIGL